MQKILIISLILFVCMLFFVYQYSVIKSKPKLYNVKFNNLPSDYTKPTAKLIIDKNKFVPIEVK